jgi:zinc protease
MLKTLLAGTILLALPVLPAAAAPVPAANTANTTNTADALKVTPPKLEVREHKLANGLDLLMYEDHSVPVATVDVWYHVGSKDEKKGRSGFAHLFEHLMFKGSANLGSEEHKNFISSIGGRYNATTDFDRTLYFQTFPSNYLERVLWMEADRMRSLDISDENFKSERDVVKEERRLRVDNPPFGRLLEVVLDKTYTTHPYRIDTIGSMADLDAATVEDVRAFHGVYYVPNNATLVVAGDLDPEQTIRWAEKYFGDIPQGKPIPREIAKEPAQAAERRAVDYHPNTPLPAVVITYHVPEAVSRDIYALQVAGNILSSGESSRLYRRMVYEKQMAVEAGGETIVLEDPGVFFFFSILQGGQKPEDGEKELLAAVDRLRGEPVSGAELVKAKNQFISELVFGRQTGHDKADAIGYSKVILGDLSLVNRQLAEYQRVTAADVQRVANAYFKPENRTVVYMLPESMRPAGEVKKP